jgi:hypothetical protein
MSMARGSGAIRVSEGSPRASRSGLRLVHRSFGTLDLKEAKELLDQPNRSSHLCRPKGI